jgi:O-antigen ligase
MTALHRRLVAATLTAFGLGVGLLVPFEETVTLAAGVVFLFAFVVLGVFTIASPEYLAVPPDESEADLRRRKRCVD